MLSCPGCDTLGRMWGSLCSCSVLLLLFKEVETWRRKDAPALRLGERGEPRPQQLLSEQPKFCSFNFEQVRA